MIKFFRKLRQNSAYSNRFGKYMLYAIGEIILVVIGILIALGINNQNDLKKDRLRAVSLLENLSEELKQDNFYFNNVYKVEKENFLTAAELLFKVHVDPDYVVENDSMLGMAFRLAAFTPAIKFSKNAYTELTTSGLLNTLRSESLKENLNDYYGQIEFLKTYSDEGNRTIDHLILELSQYYIIIPSNELESQNVSNFSGAIEEGYEAEYDLKAFRENKSLNPQLYEMIDKHKDRLGSIEIINQLGRNIQEEITTILAQ
ncbi:DUF6090 family protein [Mangrovimonas sp. AS39]|uniref:DUF6090 family protein n=1 Tax=Mangrovimonas futianensis TaxID=2895523 RepID=UPI001E5747B9|nr:DUF6090 family protein [Mangrovimonas futianensis]MCF1192237.1 DUF6090 family protein [Mangrovimonas futianensis]MCF1196014.1 DUF6090 family protein [Mangrovimonas futianensis]